MAFIGEQPINNVALCPVVVGTARAGKGDTPFHGWGMGCLFSPRENKTGIEGQNGAMEQKRHLSQSSFSKGQPTSSRNTQIFASRKSWG